MNIVIGIAVVLTLAIGILLAVASRQPSDFRLERSIVINAPPERIFALVNDFKTWGLWSPWEKKDPGMQREFSAVTAGKGATYGWRGNSDVGQGSMEILESTPSSRILIRLDFLKPFEAHNMAEFTFTPEGSGTRVNWAMYGPANLMSKVMCLFMSMDKMVGPDFEAGLAAMKATAEK